MRIALLAIVLAVGVCAATAGDYCGECKSVVGALETQGTDKACEYLHFTQPPESTLCQLIVDKLGSYIDQHLLHGDNATTICEDTGFCSSEGCVCGQCEAPVYGLRCLGLGAKCPTSATPASSQLLHTPVSRLRGVLDAVTDKQLPATPEPMGFCFTSICGPTHEGCCLTCF